MQPPPNEAHVGNVVTDRFDELRKRQLLLAGAAVSGAAAHFKLQARACPKMCERRCDSTRTQAPGHIAPL